MPPRKKNIDQTQDSTGGMTEQKLKIVKPRTPRVPREKPAAKPKNVLSTLVKAKDKIQKEPKVTIKVPKKTKNPYMVVRQIAKDDKIRMANETALCQLTKNANPIEVAVNPEPKVVKKRGRRKITQVNPEQESSEVQTTPARAAPRTTRGRAKQTAAEVPVDSSWSPEPLVARRRGRARRPPPRAAEGKHTTLSSDTTEASSPRGSECDTFAWAHDISSSSPASLSSLVLLDGKLPAIQLVDFQKQAPRRKATTAARPGPRSKRRRAVGPRTAVRPPSPVSSSSAPDDTSTTDTATTADSRADAIAQKRRILNTADLELINWLFDEGADDVGANDTPIVDECVRRVLRHEIKSINVCREFQSAKLGRVVEKEPTLEEIERLESAKSESVVETLDHPDVSRVENAGTETEAALPDEADKPYDFETFSEVVRRKTYEQSQFYDDDALSLFAESLTGIDSSRDNIFSEPKRIEVPATAAPPRPPPTPIVINVKKPVCEKQNADSTSINKEEVGAAGLAPPAAPPEHRPPPSIAQTVAPVQPTRTAVYRGHCFFNIAGRCKRAAAACLFPHTAPEPCVVAARLRVATTEQLLCEYLLTRRYDELRRRYMYYFAAECARRRLPRRVLEMAADALGERPPLRTAVLEAALLTLDAGSLAPLEDLLVAGAAPGPLLCDALMATLADTQNFTRFKAVFVSLARFVVKVCRRLPADVVARLLERVCILPPDEALTLAVAKLVRCTELDVFELPTMERFLSRLGETHPRELKKLLQYRRNVAAAAAAQPPAQPPQLPVQAPQPPPPTEAENRRYTSPDTTHLDSWHNMSAEDLAHPPAPSRTVTFGAGAGAEPGHGPEPLTSASTLPGDEAFRRPAPAGPRRDRWLRGEPSIYNKMMWQRFRFERPPPPYPHHNGHFPRPTRPGFYAL